MKPEFPEDLASGIKEKKISYGAALFLKRLDGDGRRTVRRLLEELRPGCGAMKEIAEFIFEISGRDGISPGEILGKEKIRRLLSSDKNRKEKILNLRKILQSIRYPETTARKNKLNEKITALKLPPCIRLKTPENFEGKTTRLEIKFEEIRELKEALETISAKLKQIDELRKDI